MRWLTANRLLSAQEGGMDALLLPLIEYSCQCLTVQARRPTETSHIMRPRKFWVKKLREEGRVAFKDIAYDAPVTKYIHRT